MWRNMRQKKILVFAIVTGKISSMRHHYQSCHIILQIWFGDTYAYGGRSHDTKIPTYYHVHKNLNVRYF